MKIRIDALRIGQRVDLEGDRYADPDNNSENGWRSTHPEFESEYEIVFDTVSESSGCIRVDFNSGFSCGFPPDHLVTVDEDQDESELEAGQDRESYTDTQDRESYT